MIQFESEPSSEGLTALVQKPEGAASWKGPYLKTNTVPNDPWGRAYVYVSPGQHGAYDITSLGADLPRVTLLESEYQLAINEAELRWVDQIVVELANGTLTWSYEDFASASKAYLPDD